MGRARSLAVLLAVPSALAHSTFMKYIPNGNNVHDQFGKAWVAVGHTAASPDDVPNFASDGFARNPFGWAFAKAGFVWTRELCEQDSDADGLTNGEELGDPLCVWEYGDAPSRTVNITHPGMTNADMLNASVRAKKALKKAAKAAASGLPTDAGITDGMPFRTYSSVWLPYVALPFFAWLAFGLKRFCAEDYLPRIRWLLLVWLGQCTGVGVSLGYHRYFSHKAFGANFWGKSLVGIMGSLSLQGNLYSWAYMHRIHHRLCDKELDFHSPIASDRGFVFAHATWYVTPKPHVRRGGDYYEHVIKDLLDDRDLWFVGWLTPERTILLMLVSCFLAACVACRHDDAKRRRCRLPAVTFMYFGLYAAIPVLIGWHDTMLVNSATHIFGVSPNRDGMGSDECMSRNVAWLQPFLNGENWHNNHHGAQHASAAGARAREHGVRGWLDPSRSRLIAAVLALHPPPPPPPTPRASRRRAVVLKQLGALVPARHELHADPVLRVPRLLPRRARRAARPEGGLRRLHRRGRDRPRRGDPQDVRLDGMFRVDDRLVLLRPAQRVPRGREGAARYAAQAARRHHRHVQRPDGVGHGGRLREGVAGRGREGAVVGRRCQARGEVDVECALHPGAVALAPESARADELGVTFPLGGIFARLLTSVTRVCG